MLLNEQPAETLPELKAESPKIETEEDRFFEELMELDYVMPFEEEGKGEGNFMMSGLSNRQYIDFFGEEWLKVQQFFDSALIIHL